MNSQSLAIFPCFPRWHCTLLKSVDAGAFLRGELVELVMLCVHLAMSLVGLIVACESEVHTKVTTHLDRSQIIVIRPEVQ